ncbi:MAG: hypothetical protein L7F78_25970 [Syntrophales bacterium LBB04]|nr:hypothetical protein [Syntrophales bacterium LBB04]
MNLQVLLIFQLVADIVLCIAVVFILYLVTKENRKNNVRQIDPAVLAEFQKALNESQTAATYLIQTMNDSRRALKEIAYALDEREKRLISLLNQSDAATQKLETVAAGSRYEGVLEMVRQGMDAGEIVRLSGFTKGEVDLIIALDTKKNESS